MIGFLGSVVFEVSSGGGPLGIKAFSFRDFKKTKGAHFAEHEVFGGKPLLEFTGIKTNTVSLSINLSASMGISPSEKIATLTDMCNAGKAVPLVIGSEVMGLWVITDLGESWDCVDSKGNLVSAVVSVELKEYPDG